jgi:4-hydroxybenzoate polyprenyltransferase
LNQILPKTENEAPPAGSVPPKPKGTFKSLLKLLRVRQWTKNGVCLAGAFFSGHMFQVQTAARACLVVAAFCAAASFVYVLNDVLDRDRDRNHPRKKFRPIASGEVSVPQALAFGMLIFCMAATLGAMLGPLVLSILAAYAVLNICYSAVLKNLSLVDATVVASGFLLRIYAGTAAVNVSPSAWLLLCTLFLSLFLAFGKRRAELNAASGATTARPVLQKFEVSEETGTRTLVQEFETSATDISATRGVLHKYNVTMLDRFCNICATLAIATYAIFTVLGHTNRTLIVTVPPVVMGIFRYILLIERYQEGEAPDAILAKDWAIQLAIAIWALLYVAVLYFGLHIDVQ